ncbi:type IX secretion system protein PorQ [Prevotella sp. OH937_COT-195]|uniref:type IX secretion system protein PorQ n=1 Tax=Prevotella sp. OH937_COT-195 TaxID=2491051 RepID=UPI000F651603|nr:type IX secretion system protein PorQ [Prevotella sp. OH937_COT-195]RRD02439.1 type IX secretion system protein PorQ [Prevotella sp. OH937_COT-195]
MKKVVFTLLTAFFATIAAAQESRNTYNFLRLPVSAHAGALGGDNITIIEDDPSLVFNNPALLGSVSDKTVNLNFMTYMKGAFTASASFNRIIGERATVGVIGQFVNYGTMKEVDANNVQTGEFSAKDIAIGGVLSYELAKNFVGGITAKAVTSYIAGYNSFAMGVDLGLNYYDPEREWSMSAAVKNLGGQLKAYDDKYEKMPVDVQVGMSKQLVGSPLRLSATLVDLNHWNYKFINHLVAGVDIVFSPQFYIAAGYNFRRADEMSIMASGEEKGSSHGAGLSLGAGIMLERFKLNLAYAKYHVSSSSLMVNVSFIL